MLSVIMLSVIMLSVVMLSVVMLSVVTRYKRYPYLLYSCSLNFFKVNEKYIKDWPMGDKLTLY